MFFLKFKKTVKLFVFSSSYWKRLVWTIFWERRKLLNWIIFVCKDWTTFLFIILKYIIVIEALRRSIYMKSYFLFWFLCFLSCKTSVSLRIAYVCTKKGRERKSSDLPDLSQVLKHHSKKKKKEQNTIFLFLFSPITLQFFWAPAM